MGRNIDGLELTEKQKSEIVYEWTISDFMEDEEDTLRRMLKGKLISRDEFLDRMENLRESAEERYRHEFQDDFEADESEHDLSPQYSEWDDLQDYLEAF